MRSALALLLIAAAVAGDDPLSGDWLAAEKSEGTRTTIRIYREGETWSARVLKVVDDAGQPVTRTCERCPGELKGKPIPGLRFLWGLKRDGDKWTGGHVMDLRDGLTQGTVASCEIEDVGDELTLHAFLAARVLGQSRTWKRAGSR